MTPSAPYRVWCLSWEEEEEHGANVIGYDILSHAYARERRGVVYVPSTILCDASDAARAYADYVHFQRDGWESTWPLMFRVRCLDGSVADFEVDREYVPEFRVAPIKVLMPSATHVLWSGRVLCEDLRLRGVPGGWPEGQRWISLKDVADGTHAPDDRCEACWARAPGRALALRQIGADR